MTSGQHNNTQYTMSAYDRRSTQQCPHTTSGQHNNRQCPHNTSGQHHPMSAYDQRSTQQHNTTSAHYHRSTQHNVRILPAVNTTQCPHTTVGQFSVVTARVKLLHGVHSSGHCKKSFTNSLHLREAQLTGRRKEDGQRTGQLVVQASLPSLAVRQPSPQPPGRCDKT